MMKRRNLITLDEDNMLESQFVELHTGKKRLGALYRVLTTIPEADYQKFKSLKPVYFYLPKNNILGSVTALRCPTTYIYLSERLEDMTADWILHTTAHEIAHAVLGHAHAICSSKEVREIEANEKAESWGFRCPV